MAKTDSIKREMEGLISEQETLLNELDDIEEELIVLEDQLSQEELDDFYANYGFGSNRSN